MNELEILKSNPQAFWKHVPSGLPTDVCWLWQGNIKHRRGGYGKFAIQVNCKRTYYTASKASYALHHHTWPSPDMHVRHTCDTPACVNPNHLVLGYASDNKFDAVSRRRHAHGEKTITAKLTEEQVLEIRSKYIPRKYSYTRLAKEYGMHPSTIEKIITRQYWSHI